MNHSCLLVAALLLVAGSVLLSAHGEFVPQVYPSSTGEKLNVRIHIPENLPDTKHDAWTRTYKNPEVLEWLFAQHR